MPYAWVTGWFVLYGAVVAAAVVVAALRDGPTLWRGDGVLTFNTRFVGVMALITLVANFRLIPSVAVAGGLLLATSWLLRSRWLLLGGDEAALGKAITDCARRVRATCESTDGGYRIALPGSGGTVRVRIRHLDGICTLVTFAHRPHHTAKLLRQLLAKNYAGALPKLRVRPG